MRIAFDEQLTVNDKRICSTIIYHLHDFTLCAMLYALCFFYNGRTELNGGDRRG